MALSFCFCDCSLFGMRLSADCLATVSPRDDRTKNNMQPAEPGRHKPIAKRSRNERFLLHFTELLHLRRSLHLFLFLLLALGRQALEVFQGGAIVALEA